MYNGLPSQKLANSGTPQAHPARTGSNLIRDSLTSISSSDRNGGLYKKRSNKGRENYK